MSAFTGIPNGPLHRQQLRLLRRSDQKGGHTEQGARRRDRHATIQRGQKSKNRVEYSYRLHFADNIQYNNHFYRSKMGLERWAAKKAGNQSRHSFDGGGKRATGGARVSER